MELNFWETVSNSPTFIMLICCSLVAIAFIVERWLCFRHTKLDAERFVNTVYQSIRENGISAAIEYCKRFSAPLATVIRIGLQNARLGDKGITELMDAIALKEKKKLERYLSVLGTMGNIAPFIGLLGTVIGIIRAFHALAVTGSGGPQVVSAGIAEALITTAAGLLVAIPSVVSYNYFLRRVGTIMSDIDTATKMVRVCFIGILLARENLGASFINGNEMRQGGRNRQTKGQMYQSMGDTSSEDLLQQEPQRPEPARQAQPVGRPRRERRAEPVRVSDDAAEEWVWPTRNRTDYSGGVRRGLIE